MEIPEACTKFSDCILGCWPLLIIVTFFAFSGGYIIRGLVQMASDRTRGIDDD